MQNRCKLSMSQQGLQPHAKPPPALHTMQTLMLVLSNPAPKGWAVSRLDGRKVSEDLEPVPIKTSLIVVPANLLGQVGWGRDSGQA